LIATYVTINI